MRGSAIVIVCLWGCDPIAGTDYVGESMFTLSGTFATTGDDGAALGGVALMWQDSAGASGPGVASSPLPVTVEFPATFHVAVPVPPPDAVRFGFGDGVAIAEGYIFVVADPAATPLAPLGLDRVHVLVWASADVAAGTLAADYLGAPISAGYHLRSFDPIMTPGAAQTTLIDRCVTNGDPPTACQVRRAYQLDAIADDDPLRIAVAAQ